MVGVLMLVPVAVLVLAVSVGATRCGGEEGGGQAGGSTLVGVFEPYTEGFHWG